MIRIKIGLIVLGGVLGYFGFQEWRLSGKAKTVPQTLTCSDLVEKGYGDNANVLVTNFALSGYFVYETTEHAKTWNKIWVPVFPTNTAYGRELQQAWKSGQEVHANQAPPQIKLIIKSSKIGTENGLNDLAAQPHLEGMIINEIETLSGKEKSLLEEKFPGTDFSKCLILEHYREPASSAKLMGLIVGGLLSAAVGVLWLIAGARKKPAPVDIPVARPASMGSPVPPPPAAADSPAADALANLQEKSNPYAQRDDGQK